MITKIYNNLTGNTGNSKWSNLKITKLNFSVDGEEGNFLVLNSISNKLDFSFEINCPSGATGKNKRVEKIAIRFNDKDIYSFSNFSFQPDNIFTTRVSGNFSQSLKCIEKTGNLSISFYNGNGDNIGNCITDIQVYGNKAIFINSQSFELKNGRELYGNINLKYERDIKVINLRKQGTTSYINGILIKNNNKSYSINKQVFSYSVLDANNFIGQISLEFNLDNNLDYWRQISLFYRLPDYNKYIEDYGICSVVDDDIDRIYIEKTWVLSNSEKPSYYGDEDVRNFLIVNNNKFFFSFNAHSITLNENEINMGELATEFKIINFYPPLLLDSNDLEERISSTIIPWSKQINYSFGNYTLEENPQGGRHLSNLFKNSNDVYSLLEDGDNYDYEIQYFIYDQENATTEQENFIFLEEGSFTDLTKSFAYEEYRRNVQFFLKITHKENRQNVKYCLTKLNTQIPNNGGYKYVIPKYPYLPILKNVIIKDEDDKYIFSFQAEIPLYETKFLTHLEIFDTLRQEEKTNYDNLSILIAGKNKETYSSEEYCPYYGTLTLELENDVPKKQQRLELNKNNIYTKMDIYNNNSFENSTINLIQVKGLNSVTTNHDYIFSGLCHITEYHYDDETVYLEDGDIAKNNIINEYVLLKEEPTIFYLPNQLGINCKPDPTDIIKIKKLPGESAPNRITFEGGIIIHGLVLSAQDIVDALNSASVTFSGGTWNTSS